MADDSGARNAIWSILGRTSARLAVPKNGKEDMGVLAGMTGSIAGGSGVLVEDLEQHWEEDWREDEAQVEAGQDLSASTSRGLEAKLTTVRGGAQGHWIILTTLSLGLCLSFPSFS